MDTLKEYLEKCAIEDLVKRKRLEVDTTFEFKSDNTHIKIKKIDKRIIIDYSDLNVNEELCNECKKVLNVIHHEFLIPEQTDGIIDKVKSFFKGE